MKMKNVVFCKSCISFSVLKVGSKKATHCECNTKSLGGELSCVFRVILVVQLCLIELKVDGTFSWKFISGFCKTVMHKTHSCLPAALKVSPKKFITL